MKAVQPGDRKTLPVELMGRVLRKGEPPPPCPTCREGKLFLAKPAVELTGPVCSAEGEVINAFPIGKQYVVRCGTCGEESVHDHVWLKGEAARGHN